MADPRPLTRDELAMFLPNQRAIRAFEKLFDLIPSELLSIDIRITQNEGDIDDLQLLIPTLESVDSDHTTSKNEIVVCNNISPSIVTLNTSPLERETVTVVRRDAPVTIIGPVNGGASIKIRKRYDAPSLIYVNPEWSII